jgi:hypothetical protein
MKSWECLFRNSCNSHLWGLPLWQIFNRIKQLFRVQPNPNTGPLYILPPLHCACKSQRESPSKMPPPLVIIHQHLWQFKCTIEHYNEVWHSAMLFCFHRLYRELPGIFSCIVQTPYTNNSALTFKTYSGEKPPTAIQGGSWVVTWDQRCKWRYSKSRQLQ